MFFWPEYLLRNQIKRNQKRIVELKQLMISIEKQIEPNYIQESCISLYALSKLESYFINKRADPLKIFIKRNK